MEPTFEPASAADVLLIRDLAERIWYEGYSSMLSREQIRYMLDWMYAPHKLAAEIERGVSYLLVHHERQPVGYLAWELLDQSVAHLHKLYLLPELHGQGIGRTMLERFLTDARAAGAARAELRVNKANARAQRAYARAGFKIVESISTPIGAGFVMDDYVMLLKFRGPDCRSDTSVPGCE
ncbi:MAG TPA: GNAT family N-acetyltransferase [Verrucomicrobiota bacterium]|nr:GNAT family N-acetyltransferase [Verrucomicrobiota bacterium]